MNDGISTCSICGRILPKKVYREKHHLTPKCKHGKEYTYVCIDCGDQIHVIFTEKELKNEFNTIEALKSDPRMQEWIRWIRKKSYFGVCMRRKKRK
jgi:hypothetical protein